MTDIVLANRLFVKLHAISPTTSDGRVMCCSKKNEVLFVSLFNDVAKPGKIMHRVNLEGYVIAAVFHEEKIEAYLKIGKTIHKNGSDIEEITFYVFELDQYTYKPVTKHEQIPKEPWTPPEIPQNVIKISFSVFQSFVHGDSSLFFRSCQEHRGGYRTSRQPCLL
jgi:hypothetical protein